MTLWQHGWFPSNLVGCRRTMDDGWALQGWEPSIEEVHQSLEIQNELQNGAELRLQLYIYIYI